MAAPSVSTIGTFNFGTGDVTLASPGGVSHSTDTLLIAAIENTAHAVEIPTGWTEAPSSPQSQGSDNTAGGSRITVLYKWGAGSGTASDDDCFINDNSSDKQIGLIIAITGADTTNPFNTSAGSTQTSTTSATFPGVTTTVDDCLILHITGTDRDANSTAEFSSPTNSNLTSLTEEFERSVSTGTGGGVVIHSGVMATAGATGNTTATVANSTAMEHITLAIAPASSGAVTFSFGTIF